MEISKSDEIQDADGNHVSKASWTFPITIKSGGSAVFTNGQEVSPQTPGKSDVVPGYEQITTWSISKIKPDSEEEEIVAKGTGKMIPTEQLQNMTITERDIVGIEFINSYKKSILYLSGRQI